MSGCVKCGMTIEQGADHLCPSCFTTYLENQAAAIVSDNLPLGPEVPSRGPQEVWGFAERLARCFCRQPDTVKQPI